MQIRVALYLVGGLFGLLALLAIAQAIFLGFAQLVPAGWAALLAALCYLSIASVVILVAQLSPKKSKSSGWQRLAPLVSAKVRERPAQSLLIALAAGAFVEEIERRTRR